MGNFLAVGNLTGQTGNETENCNIYTNFRRNKNSSFLGIAHYEGIPQNLIINLMGWVVLNMCFIVLRKKAWNYGRMAVMQKEELKWTDMLYGDDISLDSGGSSPPHVPHGRHQTPMGAIVAVVDSPVASDAETATGNISPSPDVVPANKATNNNNSEFMSLPNSGSARMTSAQKMGNISEIKDTGYFSWIKIVFTLTDKQYHDKCGPDCVSYLSFQRHLIVLAIIITSCSLLIILPINMHPVLQNQGGGNSTEAAFSDTTIINLENKHEFLWPHVVLAILFLFISIGIMRHYSKGLQFLEEDSTNVSHTICIIGLNKGMCREDILRAHLHQTYPGMEILEVSFAYDISKLQWLEFQRLSASSAKMYFQQVLESEKAKHGEDYDKRPTLRAYLCGVMGCCFTSPNCGKLQCKETDAIEYYTQQEDKYIDNVDKERQRSLTRPLGIAFVTFSTIESAERIVEDYACSARLLLHTPESKFTKDLNSNQWIVKFAPVPEDIYWANLSLNFKLWYVKFILVNLLLAVIVVIFSTPVFVFTLVVGPKPLDNLNNTEKEMPVFASAIVDTLPTGIVWVLGIILISLVYQSDVLIGFWTKTAGNLSEMIKIFFFLTFMVIVLPALGVTSISYFLNQDKGLSWSCIFYKENGALFVNYVCTSSLCGTAAELMRLPELFVYAVKLCFARSGAEVGAIRKSLLWDFQIGSNYAWTMLHFAIFTCFSVIYPLVTPFGLLYLILKHLVDRYNIYFAYAPCKVEREVHATAVNFVIMSMFMLQVNLLAYVHFHIGAKNAMNMNKSANSDDTLRYLQVFSLLGFSVTAALFLGQLCFNVCADFSPIHHFKSGTLEPDEVLQVGRASASGVVPQTQMQVKRRSRPSRSSDKSKKKGKKRRTLDIIEDAPLRASFPIIQSSIQIGMGGELRLIPASEPAVVTRRGSAATVRTEGSMESDGSSVIVSSNYTGTGKAYGRYIPPLLRPEFIRLVQQRQNPTQDQPQSQSTSKSTVEVITEKRKGK